MATTQISSNIHTRQENENALFGKGKSSQSQMANKSNRLALGTLGNHMNVHGARSRLDNKKELLAEKKPMTKSNATSQLQLQHKKPETTAIKQIAAEPAESQIIEAPAIPSTVRDIDCLDSDNPQLVSEYINEIYVYLRRLERQQSVRENYMEGYQITPRMRKILIDWLVQVHQRFHLLQETLYLTIAIIDRFLQDGEISKSKLQLVGVTAMWIASKYEEMYAPEIADFVYITDNAYSKSTIRQMERIMLKRLNFDLGRPLPLHFLRRYSKAGEVDSMKHTLAKYLLELSIMDYQIVHYHPSEVSAACLCLAVKLLDDDDCTWDETLQFYSTYSEEHLQPIMNRLALMAFKSSTDKQQAVKQKYQSSKFMRISAIEELQSSLIEDWAQKAQEEATAS